MSRRCGAQRAGAGRLVGRAGGEEQQVELDLVVVVVATLELTPFRTECQGERLGAGEQPVGLQRVDGEIAPVLELACRDARLIHRPEPLALELAARGHDAAMEFGPRLVVDAQPVVLVEVVRLCLLFAIRVVQVQVVVEAQRAPGQRHCIGELVTEARISIRIPRLTTILVQRVEQQVQVAAARGQQPLPAAFVK